jgi:LAS superfamily LD-carboxypeptidase LdcB
VKNRARQSGRFIKNHKAVLVTSVVAILMAFIFNVWLIQTTEADIAKNKQATSLSLAELDAIIQETKDRKAAEAKATEEAGHKLAAEAAKNGTSSTLDSKLCNNATTHTNPSAIDVLVNKQHCIQPLTFAPDDLATVNGATLSAKAINAFKELYTAAVAAGQPFYVTSSYRSYTKQVATYNRWIATSGQVEADTYSARPGYSEHQTGLAFDVATSGCTLSCFGSTSQYQWLQKNAADYGFIQRYHTGHELVTGYKAEEWHYRYVGTEVAKDMRAKGIKTLEVYWNMSGGDY